MPGLLAAAVALVAAWAVVHVAVNALTRRHSGLRAAVTNKPGLLAWDYPTPLAYPHANPARWVFGPVRVALRAWFSAGAAVGLVSGCLSTTLFLVLLCRAAMRVLSPSAAVHASGDVLTPLVPGVTVAWEDTITLFLAVAVSVFWSVGVMLAGVVPGGYVRLGTDLEARSAATRLRIVYAGAWHNVVAVVMCALALASMSFWLSMGYGVANGVVVGRLPSSSPFAGALSVGDIVTAVNRRDVASVADWTQRLEELMPGSSPLHFHGLCVSDELSAAHLHVWPPGASDAVDCCASALPGVQSRLCLSSDAHPRACGDGKALAQAAAAACSVTDGCPAGEPGLRCWRPHVASAHPHDRWVVLTLANGTDVAFLGTPAELYAAFVPSAYRVRPMLTLLRRALPGGVGAVVWHLLAAFPVMATSALRLLSIVNLSMAVFNVAPVWLTDGEHATHIVARALHLRYGDKVGTSLPPPSVVAAFVLHCGTVAAAVNVVFAGLAFVM